MAEESSDHPRFQFIDINSSDARKQARAHVMREFMRQKREERTPIGEEGPSSQGVRKRQKASTRRTIATTKKGSAKGEGQDDADSDVTERDDGASSEHDSDRAADNNRLLTCTPSSLSRRRSHSPQGMLDASRRDPFQAFPMRLDEEDLPLVDHYITVVPELMCNFKGIRMRSGVTSFNPTRDVILPQAMNNPIAFQATALAFAAGHLARLHGRADSNQSLKHRIQTLRKLREHFFGQKQHSDDLDIMVAMLSLASCEDRFGDSTAAWIHMRACMDMLGKLIGKLDFKRDRRLYTYMNWILITMTGYDACALRVLDTESTSVLSSKSTSSVLSAHSGRSQAVEDTVNTTNNFLDFLRGIHKLQGSQHLTPLQPPSPEPLSSAVGVPSPSSPSSPNLTRRAASFTPGSALHRLLTSVPGARPGVRSVQIQVACRFACAMHLNAVLFHLATAYLEPQAVEKTEAFLKRLGIRIVEQELDWNQSTETLMWILLFGDDEGEEDYGQSSMTWRIGRWTNVAKRLSKGSWDELQMYMVNCLTGERQAWDSESGFDEWVEGVRKELTEAPLSSHLSHR